MNLWAVSMVKDELDVIGHTIAHLDGQGVAGIIVADNMSTDGTYEALEGLKTDCELVITRDREQGYYQSRKMTALVHRAFARGADWVIPFDADELWYNAVGDLHAAFDRSRSDCLQAALHNYFPTKHDNINEPNPFLRITHRDLHPAPLPKVAVHAHPNVVIEQGNHDANASAPFRKARSTLEVAHFPWRSPEQYERKIRNGASAYRKTNLPEDVGAHWRQHGTLLDREGSRALRVVFETYFTDPDMELERQPAPWTGRSYS